MKTEATHPNRAAFPEGLSGPSLRALASAGVRSMDDLADWNEAELSGLHGMGPKGVAILRAELERSGRSLRVK